MLVKNLMTTPAETIRPDASLADAGVAMLRNDCGVLPVVDEHNALVGIITDRDICIALATRGECASHVSVDSVASTRLSTVFETDPVSHALDVMRRSSVRRLPVLDQENRLVGLISINDLVLAATDSRSQLSGPTAVDVMKTLKAISTHWRPTLLEHPASDGASTKAELVTPGDFDFEE